MFKAFAVLSLSLAVPAFAQTTKPEVEDVEEVRVHTGGAGEYSTLFDLPGLTDAQRKAAQEKLETRNASLRAFNDSDEGKRLIALRTELAAARRNKETEKIAPLRQQIQPLADAYLALRNKGRIEILSVLEPDQLAHYASRAVRARTLRGIESAKLTPEQMERVNQLCLDAAKAHFATTTVEEDPFFNKTEPLAAKLRKTIVDEVLTPEQREALRQPQPQPAVIE